MTTTTTAPETTIYTIPAHALAAVEAKVSAFNALAERNGLAARVSISHTLRTESVRETEFGFEFDRLVADVVVEGERLVLDGGWTVAASLDHVSADGNVVRLAPAFHEVGVPEEFRTSAATRCDHCGVRRDRNRSIVVHSEVEGFKVVGGTCVKVFLGISPESVLALLLALDSIKDEVEGGLSRRVVTPGEFVAAAALVTTVYGFVPRTAEFGSPTASVTEALLAGGTSLRKCFPEIANPSEAEVAKASALAAAAIEWIRSNDEASDFIWNLRTAVNGTEVGRSAGLLACLPNAFKRATETAAKAAVKGERKASEFIGTEGAKVTFKGSVVYTNRSEPYSYGGPESLFAIVLTEAGDTVYFSTTVATGIGAALEDAEKDAVLGFTATVKSHKVNSKGEKVTAVTRAKVLG